MSIVYDNGHLFQNKRMFQCYQAQMRAVFVASQFNSVVLEELRRFPSAHEKCKFVKDF